ncbi:MAG: hypothetical protein HQL95_14785 [Magnetococcales bacterium]|nr:hypothetical protein [Magnetococcales bacterium]
MIHQQTTGFKNQLKDILKRYPKSSSEISNDIAQLPQVGDVQYPGFGKSNSFFKHENGLAEYRLSASKGIRIVYAKGDERIVLITVYTHHDDIKESEVIERIRKGLKDITVSNIEPYPSPP